MVGVPVIINHKDINKDNADDLRVGVVNSVWYDNKDGWYWCDGIIWDETAQNLITDKNWSVSCSYDVKTANDEGGSENNIKYDMEFLDGVFTHLALVNNPRYERANIVFNSKTEIVNDKWITVHPNGEENKGRHLLLKDGETPKEAIERTYGKGKQSDKQETNKQTEDWEFYYGDEKIGTSKIERDTKTGEGKTIEKKWEGKFSDTKDKQFDSKGEKELSKKQSDKQEIKDLYSDENFKENAKRLNEQFGEKPYSEWQKDVQTILKKYGKSEADWDDAVGARKDLFKQSDKQDKKEQTLDDKIKEYENKIPKNYRRDNQTKALWLYKNDYITRSEWEKSRINNTKEDEMNVENGFITLDGGTPEERVIWVPFEVLSEKAAKRIKEIADNYKEGDETVFDFSHTRVNPTEEQINYIKDTVKDIQNKYKFKGIAQIEISSELNKGSLGVCCSPDNCSIISLSPQLYNGKHDQSRWEAGVESGFHPRGTGEMIKSVLVHEIGHAITCNSQNKTFWNEIDTIRKNYLKEVKKGDKEHPDFISGYARTNRYEFVAEAFCQGTLAKKSGKYTKQVMDCIDKHFKSEYQTKLFNSKEEDTDDNMWLEEYGLGYPIDEEALSEFEKIQNKGKEPKKVNNAKEQTMFLIEELKKLITKVENEKGDDDMEIKNEKVDKRKLIDEVAGIMKSAGCDDEDIRTAIGKMEKIGYDDSEKSADNKKCKNEDEEDEKEIKNCGKKAKNEDDEEEVEEVKEEVKEDVDNKCKNSKYFDVLTNIYNSSAKAQKSETQYVSRADREQAAIDYFSK